MKSTNSVKNIDSIYKEITAREAYGKKMLELAQQHENLVVLVPDSMRTNCTIDFMRQFPERFFNFGIAEQNTMSIAAGMALEGLIPFVSGFATFLSMRACEQVRTDICYGNLPVKIVATHSGTSSGGGTTHCAIEDIAIMRSFPNMTVMAPSDSRTTGSAVGAALNVPGPVYIRIGRGLEPLVYDDDVDFTIGKAIKVREGSDISFIACGLCVYHAKKAADRLSAEGISASVLDMHTIKPLDVESVIRAAKQAKGVITVEDHNVIGGLGSAVAECLQDHAVAVPFKRLGIPDVFVDNGSAAVLHKHYGFDEEALYAEAKSMLAASVS